MNEQEQTGQRQPGEAMALVQALRVAMAGETVRVAGDTLRAAAHLVAEGGKNTDPDPAAQEAVRAAANFLTAYFRLARDGVEKSSHA